MEVLKYKPLAFFKMDNASPFRDYSGYNVSAYISGPTKTGLPLTADATYSHRLDFNSYAYFETPVALKGRESQEFSLMATVYVTEPTNTSPQQILCRPGGYEWLSVTGNTFSFSTPYVSTGTAKCSYTIPVNRKVDVVATHTQSKNSLYIDGVLVSEVDITPEQQKDTYAYSDVRFQSGYVGNNKPMLINNVGFFGKALRSEEIVSIYNANNRVPPGSIALQSGGEDIIFDTNLKKPSLSTGWFTDDDWTQASIYGLVVEDDQLLSPVMTGTTTGGYWVDSVDLYTGANPTPLRAVVLSWDGVGETVEVSVDGVNWSAAVKNQNLSVIPVGFNPTDKALYVRVILASGLVQSYIQNMTVTGYTVATVSAGNRNVTFNEPAYARDNVAPSKMADNWGTRSFGNNIYVSGDTASPQTAVGTIEVWFRVNNATSIVLLDARESAATTGRPIVEANYTASPNTITATNATVYLDGVLLSSSSLPPTQREWHVMHIIPTGAGAYGFYLNGIWNGGGSSDITFGKVALYPTALSLTQITNLIANYTGYYKTTQSGSGLLMITEPAASTNIYSHDWEIKTT